jgi:hypothetical protein
MEAKLFVGWLSHDGTVGTPDHGSRNLIKITIIQKSLERVRAKVVVYDPALNKIVK